MNKNLLDNAFPNSISFLYNKIKTKYIINLIFKNIPKKIYIYYLNIINHYKKNY